MKPLAQNTLVQGRYLIVHLIGKGGMGEVYLAIDQRLGHPVALKRTMFADDDAMGSAFEREARTLARLRHPALPKVSDHFSEGGNQFLVMEHIAGDDLGKRLSTLNAPFPLSWVLFWADQLLEVLNYLHSNEPPIIHRDIKPQNLKLTEENNVILLDFGLSKGGFNRTAGDDSANPGSIIGYTPHFAPMEQIRGTGTGPRSDIYSLSATLYQLLTNVCPADALTRADAMLGGAVDPLRAIHEINPEVPRSIAEVISKGMTVSQDQRYGTAREMQKFLRDAYSKLQADMGAQTLMMDADSPELAALRASEAPPPSSGPESHVTVPRNSASFSGGLPVVQDAVPTPQDTAADIQPPSPWDQGSEDIGNATVVSEPPVADATMPALNLSDLSGSMESVPAAPASPLSPSTFSASSAGFESAAASPSSSENIDVTPDEGRKGMSKGMLLGILGGIVLLGILSVGGLVGVYYFIGGTPASDESAGEKETKSTASPEPSTEATPWTDSAPSPSPTMSVEEPSPTPESSPVSTPEATPAPTRGETQPPAGGSPTKTPPRAAPRATPRATPPPAAPRATPPPTRRIPL